MFTRVLFVEQGRHDHASCGPWAKDPGGFVDMLWTWETANPVELCTTKQ